MGTRVSLRLRTGLRALAIGLALGLLLGTNASAARQELRGRVLWVYDGDSLKVEGIGQVRLIGIDTPEREASGRDRFYRKLGVAPETLRSTAEKARQFNIRVVKGRAVSLVPDGDGRDRYGRLLAYVYLPDGRLLNRLLLENGLAVVYRRFDFRLKEDFLATEAEARREARGMWKP